jgi:hypothetical protein
MGLRIAPWIMTVLVSLSIIVAVASVPTVAQETAKGGAADAFKAVAPVEVLMEWHDFAYSNLKLNIVKQKKSKAIEHAYLVAELANVNMTHRSEGDYRSWAGKVRDLALQASQLLSEEKYDDAKAICKTMSDTCDACHDKYQDE